MNNAVNFFTGNYILNITIFSFLTAQVLKVVVEVFVHKKVDFRRLMGSGGFPSSHSSTVVSLAVSVGKVSGLSSIEFAVTCILAIIVMYDASNVRRAAGEQAKILNYMMEHWGRESPEMFRRELKELLGHTPMEVFVGAILGGAIALIF